VPEAAVVLAGARALDPPEEVRLGGSRITRLTAAELHSPAALLAAVGGLDPAMTGLYVHLDLDVLDAAVARVNVYSEPDGPGGDELAALLAALLRSHPVRAVSLTAYDPAFDADDRVPPIALRLLRTIAAAL
jgi:arginase